MRSVLAITLAAASPLVLGQQSNTIDDQTTPGNAPPGGYGAGAWGWGMGPGMMGPGMGSGMMGGYGYGQGMMDPGMMNGYGYGSGMMGPGMMGGGFGLGPLGALNLSDEQQRNINRIQESLRKEHWTLLGQIQEQQAALRDLYAAEQTDPKKVGEAYDKIGKLQRQMAETHARALNDVRGTLTPEQRQQWAQMQRGYRGPAYGAPGGPGRGMMGR
jgi:Spy/CpxP family protein refolding chaperone